MIRVELPAHLRTLATLVGADAAALVAEYDASHVDPDELPVASQVFETEATGRAITRRTERRAPNWGAAAAAMVLVVVIIVAGVQLLGHGGGGGNNPVAQGSVSQTAPPSSPAPTQSTVSPSEPAPSQDETPPSSAVAEAGVHVVLSVTTAKCWVLASASNGSVIYQGVLNPGDSKTFDDAHKVSLRLGNAPATHLVVNNVDIGTPSSKTNVVDLSFGPGDPTQAQG